MTDTTGPALLIEYPTTGIVLLRLNRPEKRNALATELLRALAQALGHAAEDKAIHCAVITGSARVFAAGADVQELARRDVAESLQDPRPALWAEIRQFPKPLLAAVEGWALGAGNELALCADLVVAGRSAKFGQPETNLGIIPGAGGIALLARMVGRAAATRMVLLGEALGAEQALAAGLVAEITEDGAALNTALELAGRLAGRAPLALRQAKAVILASFEMDLSMQLRFERQAFAALFGTADRAEGIAAFLEKREPEWTGR